PLRLTLQLSREILHLIETALAGGIEEPGRPRMSLVGIVHSRCKVASDGVTPAKSPDINPASFHFFSFVKCQCGVVREPAAAFGCYEMVVSVTRFAIEVRPMGSGVVDLDCWIDILRYDLAGESTNPSPSNRSDESTNWSPDRSGGCSCRGSN